MTQTEFQKLVSPSQEKLFRVAFILLKNRHDAEDALQEVFLKLWKMRESLSGYRSVEALAVTMTRNLCIDRLRSYRNRNRDAAAVESLNPVAAERDPEDTVSGRESVRMIHRIVDTLPEQQRLILHLRDIEQYEYDEIENLTGLTVNNIRVTLSRARKSVREAYMKYQNYEHRKN